MMRRRLLGLALLVAVLAAACTTEESSNPGPTLTSTTSTTLPVTSTTTADTTPTTVAPATETGTTETANTVAATTTPSSTGPTDAVVPLLIGGEDGGWLSLGAWQFDQWTDAVDANGDPVAPSIGPGTAVTVSNLGTSATGQLGESTEACFDERVGPTIDVTVPLPDPPGFGYSAVALPTPNWDLTPRPLAVLARAPATYEALGVDAFTGESVDASLGSVAQLVVTDLDGDGDDEAVAVFEYVQPDSIRGAPGDLASVLLVNATTRESSTVLQSFVAEDLDPDGLALIERFRILDVADYNGDGTLEVAVHAWYYEGSSVIVFEYDGTELIEVLAAGCGA
jgi:hypothetical protein